MTDWLDEPGRQVADEHDKLAAAGALKAVLLLDYRCPKGCLLLHVWQTPAGRKFYLPRYQLSAAKADAETAASAREYRTEDGDRKWPARGGNLDELLDFFKHANPNGLMVSCHHTRRAVSAAEIAELLDGARPGRPTRRTA